MPILTTLAIARLAFAAWKELKNKRASKEIKPQTQALKTIEDDVSNNIGKLVRYQQLSFTALALNRGGYFLRSLCFTRDSDINLQLF
ncbi:MAG: hypothetical protein Q9M50_07235 [Methylococcales bacterium]|nr:hypothetical protein [Methylococcales bacterium]